MISSTLPIFEKPQTDNHRAGPTGPALSVLSSPAGGRLVNTKDSSPWKFPSLTCEKGQYMIFKRTEGFKIIYKKAYVVCDSWSCPACSVRKHKNLYKKVKEQTKGKTFFLLTLTLKENQLGLDFNWKRLSYCWDILLKRLHRKNPNLKFFKVFELQSNGMPHIHALIDTKLGNTQLKLFWKQLTGDSFICRFENIRSSAPAYIMKYFDFAKSDIEEIRELTGKKTKLYSMSKNFLIREKKEHIWTMEFRSNFLEEIESYMNKVILQWKFDLWENKGSFKDFIYEINEDEFIFTDNNLERHFFFCEPF